MVKQAYNIDDGTGTNFWRKLIDKKILKVKVYYVEKEETPEKSEVGRQNDTWASRKTCVILSLTQLVIKKRLGW